MGGEAGEGGWELEKPLTGVILNDLVATINPEQSYSRFTLVYKFEPIRIRS